MICILNDIEMQWRDDEYGSNTMTNILMMMILW